MDARAGAASVDDDPIPSAGRGWDNGTGEKEVQDEEGQEETQEGSDDGGS